jgi:hypothetical protein
MSFVPRRLCRKQARGYKFPSAGRVLANAATLRTAVFCKKLTISGFDFHPLRELFS